MLKQIIFLTIAAVTLGFSHNKILFNGRIVGGKDANINDHPWQVSLEINGSYHTCGGSIISKNYVVTAAHCTDGSQASDFQILANTSTVGVPGTRVKVSKIYQHPDYDFLHTDYDISVLELATPLKLGIGVQAINLPDRNSAQLDGGSSVNVTGWGTLKENGNKLSSQLQVVEVVIVDRDTCVKEYYLYRITERMICAGVPEGGKDSCAGDSGGPVAANGTLYGIVSWGLGCGRKGYPGIYSNVLVLREFITESTGL